MNLTLIIILSIIGIILIITEILFIPGTGIVGLVGFASMTISIYNAYKIQNIYGYVILLFNIAILIYLIYLVFKPNTWNKVSVLSKINSKVNLLENNNLKIHDQGISTTRINPVGIANFNNEDYEVTSKSGFIEENKKIIITKITKYKIYIIKNI